MRNNIQAAIDWDNEHGKNINYHIIKDDGELIPINRPCDWCGLKVKEGYIHSDCLSEETKWWLDILY